jgi:hypothetical protein
MDPVPSTVIDIYFFVLNISIYPDL